MRIMSFNTQHCLNYRTKQIDFEIMAEAIRSLSPDIVGLNEMRGEGIHPEYTAQTERLAELAQMPCMHFAPAADIPNGGPYGNAILAKTPLASLRTIPIPPPDDAARRYYEPRAILHATTEDGLTLLVTHMGLTDAERRNAVAALLPLIRETRCILMGDFNATPEDPVLDPIRARMHDTAEHFPAPRLSFDSIAPRVKIDYIFVSRDIRVLSSDIPEIIASDHRPHVAELAL